MTTKEVRRGIAQPEVERKKRVYTPPHVVIVNHPGSGANDADLPAIAAALQRQVQEHFALFYNLTCTVGVVPLSAVGTSDWVIGLYKDADQPGALGYHDMTPNGTPLAKVFPLLDKEDGGELSVTISHELLEMLADPYLSKAVQADDGKFWAYEVCDAVEEDVYPIDGIHVSNFVTPHYFEPPQLVTGLQLDWMKLVRKPFEVRPGGYMQYHNGAGGWHQTTHAKAPRSYRRRSDKSGRSMQRAYAHVHQQNKVVTP